MLDLTQDYTYEDIDFLKNQRKYWGTKENNSKDKAEMKLCQKYIKALTTIIKYLEGEKGVVFSSELEPFYKSAFCFTTSNPRVTFESVYGRI